MQSRARSNSGKIPGPVRKPVDALLLETRCAQWSSMFVFRQLPKRTQLLSCPPSERLVDWGLLFEEGWNWSAIFGTMLLFLLLSVAFTIIWAAFKDDLSGGIGIGTMVMTTGAVLIAYVVVQGTP